MIEKTKTRGRPRTYDPDTALENARDVFWDGGFAGSSLDDLGAAMAMNRPSLYGAFGDKEALYLKALKRYREESEDGLRIALNPDRSLCDGLRTVYAAALATYLSGQTAARGCLLIGTAATEAVTNARIREALSASLVAFDQIFEQRLNIAREKGELAPAADAPALSRLASAILHTLAVRARAGEARATLEAIAESGVQLICGSHGDTIT